jgi:hypothetical protein
MGGQACVFYGAAQLSRDVDLALQAEDANFMRLRAALDDGAGGRGSSRAVSLVVGMPAW